MSKPSCPWSYWQGEKLDSAPSRKIFCPRLSVRQKDYRRQKTRQDIHTYQKTRRPGSGQVLIILGNKQVVRTCGVHQMFALQSKTRCRHFFSTSAIFRLSGSHQFQSERWLLLKRSRVEIKINIKIFKQVCVTVKKYWDAIKSILKVFSVEFSWNSILFSYLHIQKWKCEGDVLSIWDPLWLQIEGSAVCPTITSLKLTQGQVWPGLLLPELPVKSCLWKKEGVVGS